MTSRRNFIKNSAFLASGSMLMPRYLRGNEIQDQDAYGGNKLVVIQLDGGNDGLNTFIPYRSDLYYQLRPTIAIPREAVIRLNDELGLNPSLKSMISLYEKGEISVINNVGYPNPDRSHRRSLDIWQTASDSNEYLKTGWLGRMMDACCPEEQGQHYGIEAGERLCLALKGNRMKGMAIEDVHRLYLSTQDPFLSHLDQAHHSAGDTVDYLYKTLRDTRNSLAYLKNKADQDRSVVEYPENSLSVNLKHISQLINAGAETKVYYTSMSGFDTHKDQNNTHNSLLKMLSGSLSAFVEDLRNGAQLESTLIMVFSEFGRSVSENGSQGTDHGAANNVLLIGGDLKKKGILNEGPVLTDPDNTDLNFAVDFRSIYATILDNFLQVDSQKVLGRQFPDLGFI